MPGQPAAALSQGLRMGEHFGDTTQITTPQKCMADGQNKSTSDAEFRLTPQSIEGGRHTTFNRILNRHNR